ncbi:MAG TPA: class I SAM-dependent methyltransferase [Candidatus Sulfotelmatobacter sp.]|jgi:ubiquinone/menaquinone biosynthesis C-methylase UbiE|nr:class I SAM-dependent methyltransferase [Candidatus Sulfotelmatobacter sp.]
MKVKGFQDTIEWYNRNAQAYASNAIRHNPTKEIDAFASLLTKNANTLDAGCGSGRDAHFLHKKELNVVGLDISPGLLAVARKDFPEIQFIEGNLIDLPFKNETFDGIWSRASLLHFETIEDVKKALSEFNRVLKKQGLLYVLVKAQTGKEKTAIVSDTVSHHDRFFQYFLKDELENLLIEAGFQIISLEQKNELKMQMNNRPEVEWILSYSRKKNNSK